MVKKSAGDAGAVLRGVKLVKKAIEAGRNEALASPEPVAAVVIKKLVLPNGEPIPASMKELLKVDALWLGIEFDEDEGDVEAVSFEDLVEDNYGEDALPLFAEASELFGGDCIVVGGAADTVRFLYIGEPDEAGEYPVISIRKEPTPWVGGFVPFDVWLAQELGAVTAPSEPGGIAAQYAESAKSLAESNGDGRLSFTPTAGEKSEKREEDEDDDDDDEEDEEDDEDDAEEGVAVDEDDSDDDEEEEEDDDEGKGTD